MPEQRSAQHLDVTWVGKLGRLFPGRDVLWMGDDVAALEHAVHLADLVAVDPGNPAGVACFPADTGYPITLHEVAPAALAVAVLTAPGERAIVCETPLHGSVRVYDPEPWKLRGFLEHFSAAVAQLFHPAQVDNLKAGKNLAKVNTTINAETRGRHAKDALAYAAVAITLNSAIAARLEDQ